MEILLLLWVLIIALTFGTGIVLMLRWAFETEEPPKVLRDAAQKPPEPEHFTVEQVREFLMLSTEHENISVRETDKPGVYHVAVRQGHVITQFNWSVENHNLAMKVLKQTWS